MAARLAIEIADNINSIMVRRATRDAVRRTERDQLVQITRA